MALTLAVLAWPVPGQASGVEKSELSFDSSDGRVTMTRFAPPPPPPPAPEPDESKAAAEAPRAQKSTASRFPGDAKQPAPKRPPPPPPLLPAVVVLHGQQGLDPLRAQYETYAEWLVGRGFQVYLLDYYSRPDAQAMALDDPQIRRERYDQRLAGWTQRVREALTVLSKRQDVDPRRIALLGFSQGGFLAVNVAAQDPRAAALVCLYGGLPAPVRGSARKLPPTLIVHGQADTIVPVAEARTLQVFITRSGGEAVLDLYPGQGHGFALSLNQPEAKAGFDKTVRFLDSRLRKR
ncbi:hypothetical protein JCM15519_19860 [Fundidesulfovibrio butyratiphilus]